MRTKNPAFAQNINNLRRLAGELLGKKKKTGEQKLLSVEKFGRLVHRAKSTISAWETGDRQPDASEVGVICYVFDVDREQLLAGEIKTLGAMALQRKWPPQEETERKENIPLETSEDINTDLEEVLQDFLLFYEIGGKKWNHIKNQITIFGKDIARDHPELVRKEFMSKAIKDIVAALQRLANKIGSDDCLELPTDILKPM